MAGDDKPSKAGGKAPHPSEALEFSTLPNILTGPDDTNDGGNNDRNNGAKDVEAGKSQELRGSESQNSAKDEDEVVGWEAALKESSSHVESPPWSKTQFSPSSKDVHRKLSRAVPNYLNLVEDARAGTKQEHHMGVLEGVKLYKKAIGWSMLLSLAIVMEGFDLNLMASFYAFPTFRRRYGQPTPNHGYQIPTQWQSALTSCAVVGEIIGLFANGYLTDKIGNRKTMIYSLVVLTLFIFLSFFAQNIGMLLASQVLSGLPWGVFQVLSITYAAEVMPVSLRAFLTSNVNICWLIGQVISTGMLRALLSDDSQWSYRIPFALQWMWTVPILVGVIFAPESPWWLIRHERDEDAKKSLLRLTSRHRKNFDANKTIAMMKHTNEVEKYMDGGMAFLDCFKGIDLRRTEITCVVWMCQAFCAAIIGNCVYLFEQAGLDSKRAFDMSVALYGAGILGGLGSWYLLRKFGRRTLYLWGCAGCSALLLGAGIVSTVDSSTGGRAAWVLAGLVVAVTFVYDATIGPVCYSLVAEIPSTRLRVKTVALARIAYNVISVCTSILIPKMLNPTAWNWRGKCCYLWSGCAFLCFVWCYFRLPEPKGLTYMELDILFEKKADARKFATLRHRLAKSGYFNLVDAEDGVGEANEWHVNRKQPHRNDQFM